MIRLYITLICIILVVHSQTNLLKILEYLRKEFLLYYSMSGLTVTECVEICEFILSVYLFGEKILWFTLWPVCVVIYKNSLGIAI
jgi:hypothetical protein